MSEPGTVLDGRYRLVRLLASGGMGAVWEAHDEVLRRRVAVKELLAQPGESPAMAEMATRRAMREARITARLQHPNAVPVYDVIVEHGRPYLVMPYLPSTDLHTLLGHRGALRPVAAARLGAELADALSAAHALGIVHRDVKPGNVLITADGTAHLTDFGIAHALGDVTVTSTGVVSGIVSGTPAYLAPEVARGEPSAYPADVFSLGATLYAALEGAPPFGTGSNPLALLHRVTNGDVDPPRRSGPLTPLLIRMLAADPEQRPSMTSVASDLQGLRNDLARPVEATRPVGLRPPVRIGADDETAVHTVDIPERPTARPARRWQPSSLVVTVLAAVLTGILVLGVIALRRDTTDDGAASSRAAVPAPTSQETEPSSASSPATPSTAAPSPGAPTPPAAPTTAPTTAASPSVTGSAELTAAITDYYAILPAGTDEGWQRLSQHYQTSTARSRQTYQAFWNRFSTVTTSNPVARLPDSVDVTITYSATNGAVSTERTRFTFVREDGGLKIDSSTVLSST